MERFVGITAAGIAACGVALAVPAAPLGNHLPRRGSVLSCTLRWSIVGPLWLRVATIPRLPRGSDGVQWVITVTNRASGPRRLSFRDGAYAEIQLRQGDRQMYSWYRRRLWTQAIWGLRSQHGRVRAASSTKRWRSASHLVATRSLRTGAAAGGARLQGKGAERNRTAVRGFAGLCLTTRPRRQAAGTHGIPVVG
jgi:hypothetical protein